MDITPRHSSELSRTSSDNPKPHYASSSPDTTNKDNVTLECWLYDNTPSGGSPFVEGNINSSHIANWFTRPEPTWRSSHSVGLRLICRKHDKSIAKPFDDDETLTDIHAAMGIPPTHTYLMTHGAGQCGKYMLGPNQPLFLFHRCNSYSTISAVLKYDANTNITFGYILVGPEISMDAVKTAIITHFPLLSLPLLVPVLIIEVTAATIMKKFHDIHKVLSEIEERTGFGDWGSKPAKDISQKDYRQVAGNLGALDSRYEFLNVAVGCTVMGTEFTIQEIQSMENYTPPAKYRQVKDTIPNLNDRAELLLSNLKHMQMFAGIRERLRAQQNVVFSLIAQQDNLLNIGIARDSKELAAASKRDSSAMKIIAFLTTLFLPATFIAAFFAMPFFDWKEQSMRSIMNDHFWMYWVVTGPLTILVMGLVVSYAVIQNQQQKKELRDAHKSGTMTIV